MPPQTLRTAILTGKQWNCKEALNGNMIDEIIKIGNIDSNKYNLFLQKVIEFASPLADIAKNRANYVRLKLDLYENAHNALKKASQYGEFTKLIPENSKL